MRESNVPYELPDYLLQTACAAMQKVLAVAFKAAPSGATVLLLGENGTGKRQLARAIHQRSGRAAGPFVTFRHATDSWDKIASAEGGTLFFDEIGEMSPAIQAKLLQLLQEHDDEQAGGANASSRSNVRVIAAADHDLHQAVENRAFREDLYYRLNVISLDLPPLRHRMEDLEHIVNSLLTTFAFQSGGPVKRLSPASWKKLRRHSWPNNFRELEDVIERAAMLSRAKRLICLTSLNRRLSRQRWLPAHHAPWRRLAMNISAKSSPKQVR